MRLLALICGSLLCLCSAGEVASTDKLLPCSELYYAKRHAKAYPLASALLGTPDHKNYLEYSLRATYTSVALTRCRKKIWG